MELWLEHPATKLFKLALEHEAGVLRAAIGDGQFIDSNNNDRSMNEIHSALGASTGLISASDFSGIMNKNGLVEVEKDEG